MDISIPKTAYWLTFACIVAAAWWMMYAMATNMGGMPMDAGSMDAGMESMPMASGSDEMSMEPGMGAEMGMDDMAMNMRDFGPVFAMWAIMMAAMMGPTFVPTMRTYEDLITSADGTRSGSVGLVLGYFAAWVGFAALLSLVQTVLIKAQVLSAMAGSTSTWFSAGLLIAAGLYQFTSLKERCLKYCRSPMVQFLARWRPGFVGGADMGLRHGAYCVVCCWGLMAIGFVGGVMDLVWMGGATILMTLEKIERVGRWLTAPIGIGMIAWAVYLVIAALSAGGA